MITIQEKEYLKTTINNDIIKMQKQLVKITKEIDKADEILQTKKDLKAETEAKLEELNQMKQHFENNFVHV